MTYPISTSPSFFIDQTPLPQHEVKPVEEDPDSAKEIWETKTPESIVSVYNPHEILEHLNASEQIIPIYEELKSFPYAKKARIVRSTKHVTLPEILLYHDIHVGLCPTIFCATLSIHQIFSISKPLILALTYYDTFQSPLKTMHITYHLKSLRADIHEEGLLKGRVSFVIRNNKLEEIKGTYHDQPLILDPVWHPTKKGIIREEYLTIGPIQTTLTTARNEKRSVQRIRSPHKIAIQQSSPSTNDPYRTVTEKKVFFNHYKIKSHVLFFKGILIPISGHWQCKAFRKLKQKSI